MYYALVSYDTIVNAGGNLLGNVLDPAGPAQLPSCAYGGFCVW